MYMYTANMAGSGCGRERIALLLGLLLAVGARAQVTIDVTGCGTTKGCMRSPSGCTQDTCDLLITWVSSGSGVNFGLSGKIDGYVSVGLSLDKKMDAASVTACVRDSGGSLSAYQSYNNGHDNSAVSPSNAGIGAVTTQYANGVLSCKFTRSLTHANSQVFDLAQSYYIMFASGPSSGSLMTTHDTNPTVSSATIDVTSTSYVDVGGAGTKSALAQTHAIFMITGWMLCATVALMLASHFKERGLAVGGETVCGAKTWFSLHRALMLANLALTALAFLLIFVDARRWSWFDTAWRNSHSVIGTIVMILTIVNPVMSAFRPGPDSPRRPLFNWSHRIVGWLAWSFAIVNIFSGIDLPPAAAFAPAAAKYVVYGFLGLYAIVSITLGVERCRWHDDCKEEGDNVELKDGDMAVAEGTEEKKPGCYKLLTPMLLVLVVGTLCLWLALFIMFLI